MKNPHAAQHAKANGVLKKYEKKLKRFDGVYDVALGYPISKDKLDFNGIEILVYVNKKKPANKLDTKQIIPEELEGIRVDIIESNPKEQSSLEDILDGIKNPLLGGISIGNPRVGGGGTLGIIVQDKNSHKKLGLTNWHVIKKKKGNRGNPITQPGFKFIDRKYNIGHLHRWNKRLDCATFVINESRDLNARNSIHNIEGKIRKLQEPFIGMEVMKSGAKSGVTHGIVASISSNKRKIRIVPNPAKKALDNEISIGGDSGSLWVTDEANKKAVALHWGGDKASAEAIEFAMANSLTKIFDCMDIRL